VEKIAELYRTMSSCPMAFCVGTARTTVRRDLLGVGGWPGGSRRDGRVRADAWHWENAWLPEERLAPTPNGATRSSSPSR